MNILRGILWAAAVAGSALMTGLVEAAEALDNWHVRTAPTSENLNAVAFGAGRFVAVGDKGVIISSLDGTDWVKETSPVSLTLEDVVFGNELFVAVGRNQLVVTSPDGQQWTQQNHTLGGGPLNLLHDGTRFVMIMAGGAMGLSTNGVQWFPLPSVPVTSDVGSIAYGNGVYVEVGYKKTGVPPNVFSSSNLQQWTPRAAGVPDTLVGVGYGLGFFVATGMNGALITSPDGVEWTPRTSHTTGFIWDVASDGRSLVAASQWGRILTSPNAVDWTAHETELPWHLLSVAFGKSTFVAVGWDGQIVQSDPVSAPPASNLILSNPAHLGNQFKFRFAGEVGQTYHVEASSNLKEWSLMRAVVCEASPMEVSHSDLSTKGTYYRIAKP